MKFLYFRYNYKIYGEEGSFKRGDIDIFINNTGNTLKAQNKFIFNNMKIVVGKDLADTARYLSSVKEIAIIFDNAEEKCKFLKDYEDCKNVYEKQKVLKSLKKSRFPKGVIEEISSWGILNKSPYSYSFYNSKKISWGSKPEGSLRISDHWNFESCGETHCKLDTTDKYLGGVWILARYENGIYKELKRF